MKKVKNRNVTVLILLMIGTVVTWFLYACAPVREFMHFKTYKGEPPVTIKQVKYDTTKKTVVIIADNNGTEIFDLMAPYYLFSATEKINVFVVAEKKIPVVLQKGIFLLPHFSFEELDVAGISPDVIVVPNLSAMDARHQNPVIVNWIRAHYRDTTIMLSVCDGALTAAATGIYDGKLLTTHASDYTRIRKQYTKPQWVNNISVTRCGRLYSTAGVSNATDGALAIIDTIFGRREMLRVSGLIHYKFSSEQTAHNSVPVGFGDKLVIGKKVLFGKNRKVGVLLQDGANELELAAVIDTYSRTFPKSVESVTLAEPFITTGYGLTLLPTANLTDFHPDELHVLYPDKLPENKQLPDVSIVVNYKRQLPVYIIDDCLNRIQLQYGTRYTEMVKRMLDYN
ncbi:DJ-1/PfpI family protein [Chitinophaga sp. Cy-1792]|uniref:DJ-1/PfpI family protein n=1 Tax=Chitinophaga sp. Cy-1792 TaxID=2608339 RepID=UPI001423CF2E|nr:DJ-1/PfpI family protein [Chitinophaga sp. Cy-1792]NIG55034.1 hypothetical protein [Chitinophaga sp. Cy-1792]